MKAGIPPAYGSLTVKFSYNDSDSVHALFDAYPGQIAAVILEAAPARRSRHPVSSRPAICDSAAWCRVDSRRDDHRHAVVAMSPSRIYGGRRSTFRPWGKAIGNGFRRVSALPAKRELMEAGGLSNT
jgi:glutamate-1-semialdehyde 2,1-aminomutase